MVLLGMSKRKFSISYPEHTKIQQTIWNTQKKQKKKDFQGLHFARNATRKTTMDPMALNLMQTYNTQKMFLNSKSS